MGEPRVPERAVGSIPFDHALHGDSIGLDCAACHTGSRASANAFMPSKADCMDCHRLPLTENPGIETLDSMLANADERPWSHKRHLPDHVVFHHGVHAAAGVACAATVQNCSICKVASSAIGAKLSKKKALSRRPRTAPLATASVVRYLMGMDRREFIKSCSLVAVSSVLKTKSALPCLRRKNRLTS